MLMACSGLLYAILFAASYRAHDFTIPTTFLAAQGLESVELA